MELVHRHKLKGYVFENTGKEGLESSMYTKCEYHVDRMLHNWIFQSHLVFT